RPDALGPAPARLEDEPAERVPLEADHLDAGLARSAQLVGPVVRLHLELRNSDGRGHDISPLLFGSVRVIKLSAAFDRSSPAKVLAFAAMTKTWAFVVCGFLLACGKGGAGGGGADSAAAKKAADEATAALPDALKGKLKFAVQAFDKDNM